MQEKDECLPKTPNAPPLFPQFLPPALELDMLFDKMRDAQWLWKTAA